LQPRLSKSSTRQYCGENTRELPGPPYPTGWSGRGVFECCWLSRPVVLVSAVRLAGPLHAEAEGRKRQRLGKGRNQRQSEPHLDARGFISEQRRQPLERQWLPANLALAEAAVAVDAIERANDRVEQGETRFRITWLG